MSSGWQTIEMSARVCCRSEIVASGLARGRTAKIAVNAEPVNRDLSNGFRRNPKPETTIEKFTNRPRKIPLETLQTAINMCKNIVVSIVFVPGPEIIYGVIISGFHPGRIQNGFGTNSRRLQNRPAGHAPVALGVFKNIIFKKKVTVYIYA